jgi:hypothetical protein
MCIFISSSGTNPETNLIFLWGNYSKIYKLETSLHVLISFFTKYSVNIPYYSYIFINELQDSQIGRENATDNHFGNDHT